MHTPRMSGWLSAKVDDLKTATAADTNSEDIGNIDHYYNLMGSDAPIATILYVAKRDIYEGKEIKYFLKSTNMPHTYDIYNKKLTPYCIKVPDTTVDSAQIHSRGYGAILPFMYTGGVHNIQWENTDGTFSQIYTDVDAQIEAAKSSTPDDNLPKPVHTKDIATLGRGVNHFYRDTQLWGDTTVQLFKDLGIKTWEVAINPSFNNREDLVGSSREFQHFLECLQTQFEDAIHAKKLRIVGVFEDKLYESPFCFHKETTQAFNDIDIPITSSGRYNLLDEFSVECMAIETVEPSTNPFLVSRYTKKTTGEVTFYKWTIAGGNGNYKSELLAEPLGNFIPDFTITYGRSENAKRYADVLRTLPKEERHALQYDSIEKYADGVYVSVSGMRIALKPIEAGGKKVANTMDHSEQRMFLDVKTKRMKKHIHLQDWKENSRFTNISKPQENPLIFAVQAMQCFQSRAFKSLPKMNARTEEQFIDTLGSSAAATGDVGAATDGRNLEAQFGRLMEREFPDMEHIIGDQTIKRDILELPLNSEGNQAIDTLHCSQEHNLWIATQVKTGERDKNDAFHNFVNTFRLLRERALAAGSRCFGILVHYKGLKKDSAYEILSKEPGLSVVSRVTGESKEEFESRCFEHVRKIIKFY